MSGVPQVLLMLWTLHPRIPLVLWPLLTIVTAAVNQVENPIAMCLNSVVSDSPLFYSLNLPDLLHHACLYQLFQMIRLVEAICCDISQNEAIAGPLVRMCGLSP